MNQLRTRIIESEDLLNQLIKEVEVQEGTLAGGIRRGTATLAFKNLRETKLRFGNPRANLVHLTEERCKNFGITLSPLQLELMRTTFNFYYLTLSINTRLQPGVEISRLECQLDFGPKGPNEPIINSMFPTSKWRELLSLGHKIDLNLDADLIWNIGLDPALLAKIENLPADVKANLSNKTAVNTFIKVAQIEYSLGRFELMATGEGNSNCSWRFESRELSQSPTIQLALLLKVPQNVSTIQLTAIAAIEPNFAWLTSLLRDVYGFLSEKLKRLFHRKNGEPPAFERLPIGEIENWELELPK